MINEANTLEDIVNGFIEQYGDENGYVKYYDFLRIIEELKENGYESERIKRIIVAINHNNVRIYSKIEKEIQDHQKVETLKKQDTIVEEVVQVRETEEYYDDDDDENRFDVTYYIEQINQLFQDDKYSYEELCEILPNKFNPDYEYLLNLICLYYKREKVATIREKNENNDPELYELYLEDENKYDTICNDVQKYLEYLNIVPVEDIPAEDIIIVFDPSFVFSDLSALTRETLTLLDEAITDLKRNVIKGAKAFHNFKVKKAICEIKDNHLRACFEKINNMYIVYYIFEKHTQNNSIYRDQLDSRLLDYFGKRTDWIAMLTDPSTSNDALTTNAILYDEVIKYIKENMNKGRD